MRFSDEALLLSVVKYGERTGICQFFCQQQGLISGAVHGALSRKQVGNFQAGNSFAIEWSARMADQLGTIKAELKEPIAAYFLQDRAKLSALRSIIALLKTTLGERDPHAELFATVSALLNAMKHHDDWQQDYCKFELQLLHDCGFQLNLDQCVATGSTKNLTHVSPKSGAAVSAVAAEPYRNKLLALPAFLHNPRSNIAQNPDAIEIQNALALTGYFLENWLYASHDKLIPSERTQWASYVGKQ